MNIDLSSVVATLSNPETLTVERRTAGGFDTFGRASAGTLSTFTITGSKQPISGKDIARMSEGTRLRESLVLYTTTTLQVADNLEGLPADHVIVGTRRFQVVSGRSWEALGNYSRYVLVLADNAGAVAGGGGSGPSIFANSVALDQVAGMQATNVQDGIEELFDSIQTASNQITTLSGQLADAQTQLDDLTTQLGLKASASDLSNHTSSASAHGTTGAVVGTSDVQTLSNKKHSGKLEVIGVGVGEDAFELPAQTKLWMRRDQGMYITTRNNEFYFQGHVVFSGNCNINTMYAATEIFPILISGLMPNSATAKGVRLGTIQNYTNPAARIVEFINANNSVASIDGNGKMYFSFTDTTGTPGSVTANTVSGRSRFAALSSSLVITCSCVTSSSVVMITKRTATSASISVVEGNGSFTVTLNLTINQIIDFNWQVIN